MPKYLNNFINAGIFLSHIDELTERVLKTWSSDICTESIVILIVFLEIQKYVTVTEIVKNLQYVGNFFEQTLSIPNSYRNEV